MKKKTIKNPLIIGKTLGSFNVHEDTPVIILEMKSIEEKAKRILEVTGLELPPEQIALFTFLHEMTHYKQWKTGKITTNELKSETFNKTAKCDKLEEEADLQAVEFILQTKLAKYWKKKSLLLALVGLKKELTPEEAKILGILA